jgi:hypothetical protein
MHHARLASRALLLLLALTGCSSAMASPSGTPTRPVSANHFPLKFKRHDFRAYCYNTIGCEVIYAGNNFTRAYYGDKVAPPPRSSNYRDAWGLASYLGIPNFPPPAEVRWKSLDGVAHEVFVDIGAIFKDELIRYSIPNDEIPDGLYPGPGPAGEPSIFLEVNDRTISVFMKAFIPTKQEQQPGNKYSDFREDLILAWTRSY